MMITLTHPLEVVSGSRDSNVGMVTSLSLLPLTEAESEPPSLTALDSPRPFSSSSWVEPAADAKEEK